MDRKVHSKRRDQINEEGFMVNISALFQMGEDLVAVNLVHFFTLEGTSQ